MGNLELSFGELRVAATGPPDELLTLRWLLEAGLKPESGAGRWRMAPAGDGAPPGTFQIFEGDRLIAGDVPDLWTATLICNAREWLTEVAAARASAAEREGKGT